MKPKERLNHFERVSDLGCIITGSEECVLHHVLGGSIIDMGIVKGIGLKTSDYLVIPLHPRLHTGREGVHTMGVRSWETEYETQVNLILKLGDMLRVDLFDLAGYKYERQTQE